MKAWKSLKKKLTKRSNNYNPNSEKNYSAGSPDNPSEHDQTQQQQQQHSQHNSNTTSYNPTGGPKPNFTITGQTDGSYHHEADNLKFFTAPGAPQASYQLPSHNANTCLIPHHKPSGKISAFFSKPLSKVNVKPSFVFTDGASTNGTESSQSESGNGTAEGVSDVVTESEPKVGESEVSVLSLGKVLLLSEPKSSATSGISTGNISIRQQNFSYSKIEEVTEKDTSSTRVVVDGVTEYILRQNSSKSTNSDLSLEEDMEFRKKSSSSVEYSAEKSDEDSDEFIRGEKNVNSGKGVSEDFETEEITSNKNTENLSESESNSSSNQTSSESEVNVHENQAKKASEVIKKLNFETDFENNNSFELQDLVEPQSFKQVESKQPQFKQPQSDQPPPLPIKKVTMTRFKLPEKQLTRSHSSEFSVELKCKSQTRTKSLPELEEILMGDESMDEQSYMIRTHGLKTRTFDLMMEDDRKGGGGHNTRRFRDVDMTGIDITEFEPCAYSDDEIPGEIEDLLESFCVTETKANNNTCLYSEYGASSDDADDDCLGSRLQNEPKDEDDHEVEETEKASSASGEDTEEEEEEEEEEDREEEENQKNSEGEELHKSEISRSGVSRYPSSTVDHTSQSQQGEEVTVGWDVTHYESEDSCSETEDLTTLITQTIKPDDDDYDRRSTDEMYCQRVRRRVNNISSPKKRENHNRKMSRSPEMYPKNMCARQWGGMNERAIAESVEKLRLNLTKGEAKISIHSSITASTSKQALNSGNSKLNSALFFRDLYSLRSCLSDTDNGTVFAGRRKADDMPVAIKRIMKSKIRRWRTVGNKKLPMELALLKAANDSKSVNIIDLHEWYECDDCFLVIMERESPIMDLFDLVNHHKRVPEVLAKTIFWQVVAAILHCHKEQVLHRDVKLENVLISPTSLRVMLIDFGCGTFLDNKPGGLFTDFAGTPQYYPPEYFVCKHYHGKSAAVYSLGVLLYAMLCGRLPYANQRDIINGEILWPKILKITLSTQCRSLVESMMHKQPKSRIKVDDIKNHAWFKMKSKIPTTRSHEGDGSINAFLSRIKDSPFAEPFARIDAKVLAEGLVKNV